MEVTIRYFNVKDNSNVLNVLKCKGTRQKKKKCGKFQIGSAPPPPTEKIVENFPKKKNSKKVEKNMCLKCILSHFKPFKIMFFSTFF